MNRRRWLVLALVAGLVGLTPLVVGLDGPAPAPAESAEAAASTPAPDGGPTPGPGRQDDPERPSIVLVLMDDFSMDLLPTLRSAEEMRRSGASYRNAFVTDSLCCVSRASLFTGQYPHQTRVLANSSNMPNPVGPLGGWHAFLEHGNVQRSFNRRLERSGYVTGFVGKFLNEFEPAARPGPRPLPGWTEFRPVFGGAYDGWGFDAAISLDGEPLLSRTWEEPPEDAGDARRDRVYVGEVIHRQALGFIRRHRDGSRPYFLEVAPYAPHSRVGRTDRGEPLFPPAMQDRPQPGQPGGSCGRVSCSRLDTDDLVGWGDDSSDNVPRWTDGSRAVAWRRDTTASRAWATRHLRNRARMAQSVDRTVEAILREVDDNTYVVLTSDNGFHLGQNGLRMGKGTPYGTDVRVPLLVVGPDVAPGPRRGMVQLVDLASTFEDLAGLTPAPYRSGTSLRPSFDSPRAQRGRYVFAEHTDSALRADDPDKGGREMASIPTYTAVRSAWGLLVRHELPWRGRTRIGWEYYDYTEDSWERTNTYAAPRQRREVRLLRARLEEFLACREHQRDDRVPARCRDLTR